MSTVSPDSVAQLRAFIERLERMHEERKAIADDIKEIYAEAKGNGFDVPTIKTVLKIRGQDHAERMEKNALLELYLSALGMAAAPSDEDDDYVPGRGVPVPRAPAPARTREIIEEFDPETGEITEPNATPAGAVVADASGATAGETAPIPHPVEGTTPTSTADGDESGGLGRALVVADNVVSIKKRLTFNDPAHAGCLEPERCGGFSNLGLCQKCREATEQGQVA